MINLPWDEPKRKPAKKAKKKAKKKPVVRKKAKKKPAKKPARKKVVKKKAKKKPARKKVTKKTKKKAVKKTTKKAKRRPIRKGKHVPKPQKKEVVYSLTHVPSGLALMRDRPDVNKLKEIAEGLDRMKGVNWGAKRTIDAAMSDSPPKWWNALEPKVNAIVDKVMKRGSVLNPQKGKRPDWSGRGKGRVRWVGEEIHLNMAEGLKRSHAEVLYPKRCWAVHK